MTAPSLLRRFTTPLTVRRTAAVGDGKGAWTHGAPTEHTVMCDPTQWTTEDQVIARQSGRRISYYIDCAPDADIRRGDEVEWTDAAGTHTADVESVVLVGNHHHKVADVEERQT